MSSLASASAGSQYQCAAQCSVLVCMKVEVDANNTIFSCSDSELFCYSALAVAASSSSSS